MKPLVTILLSLLLLSVAISGCRKYITHERFIANASSDTVIVINPDFDSVYTIAPNEKAMIYSYEKLDHKTETPDSCGWLGKTLYIYKTDGDSCHKAIKPSASWTSTIQPSGKRDQLKSCTLTLTDDDF